MNNQPKTRQEWYHLIEEFKQSGLKQSEFCKSRELVLSRFNYYLRGYNRFQKALSPPSFSQVIVQPISPSACEIKIELPNGFRCLISTSIQPEQLRMIMGVLLTC